MKRILIPLLRFIIYCLLMYLCTIPINADFQIGEANETNAIEIAQQSLLLITVLVGFLSLGYSKFYRAFMIILSLFISLHLIRELDAWFDSHIFNLGWLPYVIVVAVIMLTILIKNLKPFIIQVNILRKTTGFGMLLLALANLHVFTRIYGKPSNWDNIMGDNYLYSVERISEESVELIAYMMILIAMTELFIFVRNDKRYN